MKLEPRMLAVAIGSALLGAIAVAAWNSRGSYSECVVSQSRGVPKDALPYVRRMCRERYPGTVTR